MADIERENHDGSREQQYAQPHDALFRRVFANKEAQQDLIQCVLPVKIVSRFRLETVRDIAGDVHGRNNTPEASGEPGSGTTTDQPKRSDRRFLESGRVDLLLAVETTDGIEEYVYVLLEHKSWPDRYIAIQLLPAGVPATLLKAALSRNLPKDLRRELLEYILRFAAEEDADELLTELDRVVYTRGEDSDMRSVADVLEERGIAKGLEQGLERGLEQGLEKGLEQGQVELLVRQLKHRFGLTEEEETRVRQCRDTGKIGAAADAFAEIEQTKESILALLD